ncbi:MAG: hypothetical protein KC457_32725, partial [Myxococcales bacterium]|nr:hypothetical protein [Myxococcales bacterium]
MSRRARRGTTAVVGLGVLAFVGVVAVIAVGHARKPGVRLLDARELEREDGRLGGLLAPEGFATPGHHGSTIVADAGGLWILERTAGALIRSDHDGQV